MTPYQKFIESKQESLRLAIALNEFFLDEDPSHLNVYTQYLRRRIRPAGTSLAEQEDLEKLDAFEKLGWFTPSLVDEFLQTAIEAQKPAAIAWLMHLKDEKYGYSKPNFFL